MKKGINRKLLEAQWLSYTEAAIPLKSSPAAVKALKLAFYAGGQAFLQAMREHINKTPADLQLIPDLEQEIREFAEAQIGHYGGKAQ